MCTVQTQSFSDPCFPAFGLNTEKYEPKKFPHLDIFREVPPLRNYILHLFSASTEPITHSQMQMLKRSPNDKAI